MNNQKKALKKATITPGQLFVANSHGEPSLWEVTARVKTEQENRVWTRCIIGYQQERQYTGPQFGFLIRKGIVKLIKRNEEKLIRELYENRAAGYYR